MTGTTLSKEECKALLDLVADMSVSQLLADHNLCSAVMKMKGDKFYHSSPTAGSAGVFGDDNELWLMTDSYVQLIKSIRQLTGFGLKEAKDFVDEYCGRFAQGDKFTQHELQTIVFAKRHLGRTYTIAQANQVVSTHIRIQH